MQVANVYSPLTTAQMKSTTAKALSKWWQNRLTQLSLKYQVDADGKIASVDNLGEDFIVESLIWKGAITPDVEYVTLGELAESRELEQELVQFEVEATNVEKILTGTENGLLKSHPLMRLIEIVYMPRSDQWIIGGGRNRLVALLTICKQIYGWEHFRVPVTVLRAATTNEVVDYIKASNTSRRMSQTEKVQLNLAASGTTLQVFSSLEEIFAQAKAAKTVSMLKDLARMAFASGLSNTAVGNDTTINALGDIGAAYLNALIRALNNTAPKTSEVLLLNTSKGQVFEIVVRYAIDALSNNWSAYKAEITKDTGKKTKDGAPIIECNISRHGPKTFATMLTEMVMQEVGAQLAQLAQQQAAEQQRAKANKAVKSEADSIRAEMRKLDDSVSTLMTIAGTAPPEFLARINETKIALQARLDALEAPAATAPTPAAPVAPTAPAAPAADDYNTSIGALLA